MTLLHVSTDELTRLDTIKKLDQRKLSQVQAAELLGLSTRQIRRVLHNYRQEGVSGLISKKRGMPSNRRYPESFKEYVLHLVRENYSDFGPTLACEKLGELHEMYLAAPTLRNWMLEDGIWISRKEQRKKVHQPRNRRDCFGELVQIDGSDHHWFEDRGPRCVLLVYIDDATSTLLELCFVASESTFDYFYATQQYLERYGKPIAFYSDQHAVFRVNKKGATGGDGMTQFGRALHALNIDIICANSSQAKGRVERANRTLQDRLVKELRLQNINNVEEGNKFLNEFREDFNRRFSKPAKNSKDVHRPLAEHENLEEIFTWQEERSVTKNLTVQYDRVVYLLEPNDVTATLINKKVQIYDFPDGTIDIRYDGLPLPFSVFDKVRQVRQADVVSNKRLGTVLGMIKEAQKVNPVERSKKAPKRRGQKQRLKERKVNSAAVSG